MQGRQDVRAAVIAAVIDIMGNNPIDDDTASLAAQGMTSVETLSLVVTLEDELEIAIPDDQLTPGNFSSIERIVSTVTPLTAAIG